jgi:hypothetical protein
VFPSTDTTAMLAPARRAPEGRHNSAQDEVLGSGEMRFTHRTGANLQKPTRTRPRLRWPPGFDPASSGLPPVLPFHFENFFEPPACGETPVRIGFGKGTASIPVSGPRKIRESAGSCRYHSSVRLPEVCGEKLGHRSRQANRLS